MRDRYIRVGADGATEEVPVSRDDTTSVVVVGGRGALELAGATAMPDARRRFFSSSLFFILSFALFFYFPWPKRNKP